MARRVWKILVPAIVGVPALLLGTFFMAPSFADTTRPVEHKAPVELHTTKPDPADILAPASVIRGNKPTNDLDTQHPRGGCVNCLSQHD